MNEVKIKIKLPSEVVVHIPAFAEVSFEDVAQVLAKDGVKLIQQIVKERALEAFVAKHEKLIGKAARALASDKEGELKRVLEIK